MIRLLYLIYLISISFFSPFFLPSHKFISKFLFQNTHIYKKKKLINNCAAYLLIAQLFISQWITCNVSLMKTHWLISFKNIVYPVYGPQIAVPLWLIVISLVYKVSFSCWHVCCMFICINCIDTAVAIFSITVNRKPI